jgi:hypothetical protein
MSRLTRYSHDGKLPLASEGAASDSSEVPYMLVAAGYDSYNEDDVRHLVLLSPSL